MKKRTVFRILIFACSAAVLSGAFLLFSGRNGPRSVALIYSDGELLYTIDLSAVSEPYEFTVKTPRGENTILAEPGRISVSKADCPDLICVNSGPVPNGLLPIVCLPHRLVIETETKR